MAFVWRGGSQLHTTVCISQSILTILSSKRQPLAFPGRRSTAGGFPLPVFLESPSRYPLFGPFLTVSRFRELEIVSRFHFVYRFFLMMHCDRWSFGVERIFLIPHQDVVHDSCYPVLFLWIWCILAPSLRVSVIPSSSSLLAIDGMACSGFRIRRSRIKIFTSCRRHVCSGCKN